LPFIGRKTTKARNRYWDRQDILIIAQPVGSWDQVIIMSGGTGTGIAQLLISRIGKSTIG
jgi:hypothetical protein